MFETEAQAAFQARACDGGDATLAIRLASQVKAGDAEAALALAALFLHAAALAPEQLVAIYDGAAEAWLGWPPRGRIIEASAAERLPPPDAFWPAFWALVLDVRTGKDALDITTETAALAGALDESFRQRTAAMALAYPGVAEAAAQGWPARFNLQALSACPADSLGRAFHSLIVDNGFDLEVLDRDALGLAALQPPLDYLNARILQCHDLWHILAGYQTTALHEVAISAFQMAQFGHHYSSVFLAVTLARVAATQPDACGLMLDVILTAWTHGRESPPLIGVAWEELWELPVETLRIKLGLTAYASPYPADLLEQLRAA